MHFVYVLILESRQHAIMSSSDPMINREKAETFKATGNAALAAKKPVEAIKAFTEALLHAPTILRPVLISNRSLAHLEANDVIHAEEDARACILIDDAWWRSHARLGAVREAVSDYLGAARSYSTAALRAGKTVEAEPMRSAAARALNLFETAAATRAAEIAGSPRPTLATLSTSGNVKIDVSAALKAAPTLWELASAHPSVRLVGGRVGRGRALVTSRAIRKFEPLIIDSAITYYPQYGDSVGPGISALAGYPYYIRPGAGRFGATDASRTWVTSQNAAIGILLQLAPFSAEAGELFSSTPLPDSIKAGEIFHAAAALNALSSIIDEDAPSNSRRIMFIAPVASLVNHSCAPNCSYEGFWDTERGAPGMRIFAETDISEGEEITISYVDRALPTASRQLRLREYGFECNCTRCLASTNGGGDDSLIFSCIACKEGRVPYGARACETCGVEVVPMDLSAANTAKQTWLSATKNEVKNLISSNNTGAMLPFPSLHISDQSRFAALYAHLGSLWSHDNENVLRCTVSAAVVDSLALGRSGRGPVYACDALLIAGHYHALAAVAESTSTSTITTTSTAKSIAAAQLRTKAVNYYRRAAILFRAAFGDRDPRALLSDDLVAKLPTMKVDIERAEQKKLLASSSWIRLYNIEPARVKRWSSPCASDPSTDSIALEALTDAESETTKRWLPWRVGV